MLPAMEDASESRARARRPVVLLVACAALGLALAASGLLRGATGDALPEGAVARVNDSLILEESYERLLAALASDRRDPLTDADRERVLDRMIEEELLVQRGLALGLASVDRRVRADLVGAVIASIAADAERRTPDADDLRALYAEDPEFFTRPGRVRARQIFFRLDDGNGERAAERAAEAKRRLDAGEDFETVRREVGDTPLLELPGALLPGSKLQEYVGPSVARAALELGVGVASEPLRSGTGLHVLVVAEREPAHTPPFESIEAQVRAEWKRRRGDRALREYLDSLRADADVTIAPRAGGDG